MRGLGLGCVLAGNRGLEQVTRCTLGNIGVAVLEDGFRLQVLVTVSFCLEQPKAGESYLLKGARWTNGRTLDIRRVVHLQLVCEIITRSTALCILSLILRAAI